jgi:hypothetical protein
MWQPSDSIKVWLRVGHGIIIKLNREPCTNAVERQQRREWDGVRDAV